MYREESEKIGRIIRQYFEGIYQGNITKLQAVFNKDVIIYGDLNNDIPYQKTLSEYLEGVKTRKSPKELGELFRMKIISIEIIGKVAVVKAQVPMLGYNYYDFLSLTVVDGSWKIVNKLFAHVE